MHMGVTIKDVARESGCSVTTVSFVLNGKDKNISNETIRRIRQAVDKLGYRPNRLAVSLVTKKTRIIGLIIPDNCNQFFGNVSKVIETYAWANNYNIIYGNSGNDGLRDIEYINMFIDRRTDGIMLVKSSAPQQETEEKLAQLIAGTEIPLVTLDRTIAGANVSSFSVDNRKGGYIAARHLLELGHRKIGCYTGPRNVSSADERTEGYKAALAEYRVAFDPSLLFEGDYQMGRAHEAFLHFRAKGVTAVFAQNDVMAFGLYREMQKAGLSIPGHLSIVGFDDNVMSDIMQPPLTTVRQPIESMSVSAIRHLILRIENADEPMPAQAFCFEPELIERKSTAVLKSERA